MTSLSSSVDGIGAVLERIGSDAPARDSRPVGADDRAVVAVEHDPDGEPYLPGERAERLPRTGFIEVDRKGLLTADVYARP